ncbi:hypothetical protein PR202_gb24855 [Eleusine coracana subsp. coracana]|uniref:non-specific serine/threonine protein kinase n=1 Tax=Eleusine coracana subsp. coracana TaxID=191504 RepID=A0AAV5FNL4_ELECO|nr:hypothetical protein PR202_gb24855 [Eleusine coracana subsp. coracana]
MLRPQGLLPNGTVAVKKLQISSNNLSDDKFNKEVCCLMRVNHKNIVRFLGYCSYTQGEVTIYDGKQVMADIPHRLLCFEYLENGSLSSYITDVAQGLEWRERYQIIKGICDGLHYLHENKIVHSDLKPSNILLDYDMVPKIADFGLSRCFDQNQSRTVTSKVIGTMGYMAPESFNGLIAYESDIFSLGVIIMEILIGEKGHCEVTNVRKYFIDHSNIIGNTKKT